ncbi:MAG: High-affinity branched-chain amino acid transport ATP-binding protein [Pseudomonadota bacterium]|jgi:branched-chain amino acid transport system ATP-binding protein
MAQTKAYLTVEGLSVAYGGIQAVKGIDLTVQQGQTVALIGANGAGKSSTLRAITGLVPKADGRVLFDGDDITALAGHALPAAGLVMVPEGRGIFARMTITENLLMGAYSRPAATRALIQQDLEAQFERFPRLKERAHQLAGTLSGGEQQMLAMGRALMAHPRLLLLDEPSMGLSPIMVDKIFQTVTEIAQAGTSILLVEQNARLALQMADWAYVLESGQITEQGAGQTLLNSPAIRAAYLGE